jgi:ribosome-associated protein
MDNIQQEIMRILDEKKAENIIEIDTSKLKARITDACIIASGTSSRHMQSIADQLYRVLKQRKQRPLIEGNAKSGWVLLEASGIEIHLFKPELREYYDLEALLSKAFQGPEFEKAS